MKKKLAVMTCFCLILGLNFLSAETWSTTKRLTWTAGESRDPDIAVDSSNNIFIVYYDYTSGVMRIFFKRSLDGGSTWTSKQMTYGVYNKRHAKLGVDAGDTLHMIYQGKNFDIMHRKTTDAGNTWSTVHRITWNPYNLDPDFAFGSGNTIYAVWSHFDSVNYEIYFKKSTTSGTTWTGVKRLTWNSGESTRPRITVDSTGSIHVIWQDKTPGQWQIFYKKSTDGGSSWSGTYRLTWASLALRPVLAKDSSDNLFMFFDTVDSIYFRKSTNKGASWIGAKRITWTKGSLAPDICIDSTDTIHLCWNQYFAPTGSDICYKQSTSGGNTWTSYKRVTWGIETGTDLPAITFDANDDIHMTFDANKPGNREIYYKNRK